MRTFKQVEGALAAANNKDQLTAYYKFLRYDEELRSTTIFNNISLLRDYYNNYESISKENLLEYLATKNTKVDYYVIIRKFARYLVEIKQLDETLLKEIESIKIKQKKIPNYNIDPEKIKKWAIPQNRWSEVFVQANTNPQKMVYFNSLKFNESSESS